MARIVGAIALAAVSVTLLLCAAARAETNTVPASASMTTGWACPNAPNTLYDNWQAAMNDCRGQQPFESVVSSDDSIMAPTHVWNSLAAAVASNECDLGIEEDETHHFSCVSEYRADDEAGQEMDEMYSRAFDTAAEALQSPRCAHLLSFERASTHQRTDGKYLCDIRTTESDIPGQPTATYATELQALTQGECANLRPGEEALAVPVAGGRFRCEIQAGNTR